MQHSERNTNQLDYAMQVIIVLRVHKFLIQMTQLLEHLVLLAPIASLDLTDLRNVLLEHLDLKQNLPTVVSVLIAMEVCFVLHQGYQHQMVPVMLGITALAKLSYQILLMKLMEVYVQRVTTVPTEQQLLSNAHQEHIITKQEVLHQLTAHHVHQGNTVKGMVGNCPMINVIQDGIVQEVLIHQNHYHMEMPTTAPISLHVQFIQSTQLEASVQREATVLVVQLNLVLVMQENTVIEMNCHFTQEIVLLAITVKVETQYPIPETVLKVTTVLKELQLK